jgi:hypothetical protein
MEDSMDYNEDGQVFEKWPKIPRMTKAMPMIITEKLDGTNAQINIYPGEDGELRLQAGSRKRWIYPGNDNFGFAQWCEENKDELIEGLGEGRHFGEWCGPGIQKNIYELDEKQLFLFNTLRWHADNPNPLPCGIRVVPVLYSGGFDSITITDVMENLNEEGSHVGGDKPEGIIIYLPKSRQLFKRTFEYEEGKWGDK